MSKKQKYYVVWEGNKPGIYDTWQECQLQIKGFPNARYKSFESLEEAVAASKGAASAHTGSKKSTSVSGKSISKSGKGNIRWDSIAVDAACSGNPGIMEYRGVITKNGEEIFHQGPYYDATNNIGEFLALVHCLAYLQKHGDSSTPIYSDSKTALAWVRNKKAKTNLVRTARNTVVFDLIHRAENWLKNNPYQNPLLKWETESWGEIPADFGRK